MDLNTLDVRIEPWPTVHGDPWVDIWIDGRRLFDLVGAAEAASALRAGRRKATGCRCPLPLMEHRSLLSPGKPCLLVCDGCGEPGCWPLLVDVAIADRVATWSDFRNPHLPNLDYRELGPFRFDEERYRATWTALIESRSDGKSTS